MASYCITFRIADKKAEGKTYAERYRKLIDNARAENSGYWEETTSFILAESALDTDAFASRLSRGISKSEDLVVVFDPEDMSCVYFRPLEHRDVLRSFFPRLKKLP